MALGSMGMDVDSFYDLTPRQFQNKVKGYQSRVDFEQDQHWERARVIAFFAIKGHDSKNKIKTPHALFALPGDKKKKNDTPPPMTKEEALALVQKWK